MRPDIGLLGLVALVGLLLPTVPYLPLRLIFLVPLTSLTIHPLIVATVAAIATAIGTLPLYSISALVRDTSRIQGWMDQRHVRKLLQLLQGRMFLAILVFALMPLPDQLLTTVAGIKRYPVWKLLVGFFVGRLPYFLFLAYLGVYQSSRVTEILEWWSKIFGRY